MPDAASPFGIAGNAPILPNVAGIEKQQILAVAEIAFDDPDVIALWYGETDISTPKFICDAAAQAMAAGDTFYSHKRGTPDLINSLADYTANLYDIQIEANRFSLTASGMSAIMLCLQALIAEGDNAIIVSPVWPNAQSAIRTLGGEPRYVTLTPGEKGFDLDLDKLKAACDDRTKVIFVNSPNNPTGWVMPSEQQKDLLDFAREKGIWIMADEVYARMVYEGKAAPSFLSHAQPDDPLLVVNSFSKSWAMTGWRIGWIIHPPQIGELLGNLIEFNYSCVPPFLQRAAKVAIEDGEDFVREMTDYCRRGRDIVMQRLPNLPRIKNFAVPEASFYAFFQIEGGEDTLGTAQDIVRKAKVGIAPGTAFGPGAEGWYRLCFAQKPERISEAMDRLETYLKG
ncbi:pyridoxal phosphate-dependent aminotransferase [Hwanghaeella sp.]|uniref:pyridoxal phosphate-dependent aminotransferase n=1 Tax=Hwanghaeella sp. TaxID=2605943 RepID=UPI003CCC030F